MCEIALYSIAIIGALVVGVLVGWLGGFVHGSYWRAK